MFLDTLLTIAACLVSARAAPQLPLDNVRLVARQHSESYPPYTQAPSEWMTWHSSASNYLSSSTKSTYYTSTTSSTVYVTTTYAPPPTSTVATTTINPSPSEACGTVSSLASVSLLASPSAAVRVPAQLAYECLNSIPFNQSAAEAYLASIDPYITWQTTLTWVKDPPAEYAANVQAPYDFYATWAAIKANTTAGAYKSEYEFGWTVYRAAQLVHDGHFVFYPDSVTGLFSFGRGLPLVSVSLDGVSKPQPYLYSDIVASSNGNASFTPSPITQINGQDAIDFLLVWSEYGSLQDPDALWNNLFYEPAQIALGSSGTGSGTFSGGGRGRWPYPGPTTTLSFTNGSTLTHNNYANVLQDFTNITSGADVYEYLLTPPPEAYQNAFEYASSTAASPTSSTPTPTPTATSLPAPGYPAPFVGEANNLNTGYFIDDPEYEDVAVLAVRSFVGATADELPFQSVNTYFIETAAAMGKTKLIIDVSANGGGTILQGYDLFKQLFPAILPYGATRLRAHDALYLLGEQDSYLAGLAPRSVDDNVTYQDIESSVFNYRTDANVNYQPFVSWPEKYGPETFGPGPDNFTSIIRWNMSDVLTPLNSGGIDISGYLNRTNITTQYFAPENIIVLTDGYCASTCTIFTELMTEQGIKTVNLGGRPTKTGITQAIGGVKGTNDFPFDFIFSSIAEIYGASNSSLQSYWPSTVLTEYNALALYRSTNVVVNARDGYRPGDATNTPLQFVYQPADCRILYTPAMVLDQSAVWKTVTDSVWGGGAGNACVAGSLEKRDADAAVKSRSHKARRDLDYRAIVESFDVQTGSMSMSGAESVMIP